MVISSSGLIINCFQIMQEAPDRLKSTINNFTIELSLKERNLFVELLSEATFEEFSILIDQKYLEGHAECSQLFKSPEEIYDMLAYLIPEKKLKLNEDGSIQFEMKLAFGPMIRSHAILIQCNKREISQEAKLQKRLSKAQEELSKSKERNAFLQQKMEQMLKKMELEQPAMIEKIRYEHNIEIEKILADRQAQLDQLKKLHAEQMKAMETQFLLMREINMRMKQEMRAMEEKHKVDLNNTKAEYIFKMAQIKSEERKEKEKCSVPPPPPPPPPPPKLPQTYVQYPYPLIPISAPHRLPPPPPPPYKKRHLFDDDED